MVESKTSIINVLHGSIPSLWFLLFNNWRFAFIVRQYQIRKANQLAIKESEERLKLTLWSSGDELWDWDVYRGQVYRANTWGTLIFLKMTYALQALTMQTYTLTT